MKIAVKYEPNTQEDWNRLSLFVVEDLCDYCIHVFMIGDTPYTGGFSALYGSEVIT